MKKLIKYQNLSSPLQYTDKQVEYIESLGTLDGTNWDISSEEMKDIKNTIKSQLEILQDGYCIYCGRHKNLIGDHLERDHIAPKNSRKYPVFMFEPFNLVLACHGCNGSSKKGQMDTITNYNANYSECSFNIVHPYFDNFFDHITYSEEQESIILKPKSDKGEKTINTFDLNNLMLADLRGKDIKKSTYELSMDGENTVEEIVTNTYTT